MKTGYERAMDLIMSGKPIKSHDFNRAIGWKWATRLSEVIRDLKLDGYKVDKSRTYRSWTGSIHKYYQLIEKV